MISVVGLGCLKDQITLAGATKIRSAKKVFVKTALTETFDYFKENNISCESFDSIYEKAEDFNCLDELIVERLLKEKGDVCYCVNGSGLDDRSVMKLQQQVKIKLFPSVSLGSTYENPNVAILKISAYELISAKGFNYDTNITLTITDVDNKYIASDVKLALSNILGDEQEVFFNRKSIKVYEIDRQKTYDYKSTIICNPIDVICKKRFNFIDLYSILCILRSEHGCDWDKVQTHETIRENVIEEAYELVDAINNKDIENMIEESGDLLLQSMFHCVIGEDLGEFNKEDALSGICKKLIERHPHVFGNIIATNTEEALKAWDAAKVKEKKYTSFSNKMECIAKAIPTLIRVNKIQNIAKKASLDFASKEEVNSKLLEEIKEFNEASADKKEMEAGDLLFSAVNVLRLNKIDPEVALNKSLNKFVNRFKYVESHCNDITQETAEHLNELWEEAKLEDPES